MTALKDEIDRRFSTGGGMGTIDSGLGWATGDEVDSLQRAMSPVHHHYDNEDQVISTSMYTVKICTLRPPLY